MEKRDIRKLLGNLQYIVHIAETCSKNNLIAFHRQFCEYPFSISALRHRLNKCCFYIGHFFFKKLAALVMSIRPTSITNRPNIDKGNFDFFCRRLGGLFVSRLLSAATGKNKRQRQHRCQQNHSHFPHFLSHLFSSFNCIPLLLALLTGKPPEQPFHYIPFGKIRKAQANDSQSSAWRNYQPGLLYGQRPCL